MPTIRTLQTDEDILLSWPSVYVLRPHLKKEDFLAQVREQEAQGYRMIGLVLNENGQEVIPSFSGFRPMYKLSGGRSIYIDDLSTLPEYRGKGYAGLLLDYIHELARKMGMSNVQLDSGHHRSAAHRLYLNKGYVISSHHFTLELE